jgi:two-component sensor histidine kinase
LRQAGQAEAITITGSACRRTVAPQQAQSLVLAFHELATNATKYGALSVSGGRVEIRCEAGQDDDVVVCWTEAGGPPVVQPPIRRGFGTRLLQCGLARDLGPGSRVQLHFEPTGLQAMLRFTPASSTPMPGNAV